VDIPTKVLQERVSITQTVQKAGAQSLAKRTIRRGWWVGERLYWSYIVVFCSVQFMSLMMYEWRPFAWYCIFMLLQKMLLFFSVKMWQLWIKSCRGTFFLQNSLWNLVYTSSEDGFIQLIKCTVSDIMHLTVSGVLHDYSRNFQFVSDQLIECSLWLGYFLVYFCWFFVGCKQAVPTYLCGWNDWRICNPKSPCSGGL
jgi:hypothetical protein